MRCRKSRWIPTLGLLVVAAALAVGATACRSAAGSGADLYVGEPEAGPALGSSEKTQEQKGAAQMWADNCMRCHNSRSPSSYSDGQWNVAVHHMRIRANLTAQEYKAILEFLKAGN